MGKFRIGGNMPQEDMFMKYLHSIGQQLGAMFSAEAAGTVQDAFFRNLSIKPTGMISVNKEVLNKDKEKESMAATLRDMYSKQPIENPYEAAKKARGLKIKSIPINMGTDIAVSEKDQSVPIFGNEQQKAEGYPQYSLQGAEYAPIVDRFVSRITGKPTGIVEMMQNAMTNVKNIPLALFYGENIPISNMKDLLNYALYNKAKEYNPTMNLPGYKITTNSNIKNVTNAYESYHAGGSGSNTAGNPINANAGSEGSVVGITFTALQNKKTGDKYDVSNLRLNKIMLRDKKTNESYVFYNDYNNNVKIQYYDNNGNFKKEDNIENGFARKLTAALRDPNKEIIDKSENNFKEGYATSGTISYNRFNDISMLNITVNSPNITNDDRSGVTDKVTLDPRATKDVSKDNLKRQQELFKNGITQTRFKSALKGKDVYYSIQAKGNKEVTGDDIKILDNIDDFALISLTESIGGSEAKQLKNAFEDKRKNDDYGDDYYKIKAELCAQLASDGERINRGQ